MVRNSLALVLALSLVPLAAPAAGQGLDGAPQGVAADVGRPDRLTGGQSYGDRNRGGGAGFYSYPSHRRLDGTAGTARRPVSGLDPGTSPYCNNVNCHGSAYYGPDYGAPYHGGAYYDRGTYYRERRD